MRTSSERGDERAASRTTVVEGVRSRMEAQDMRWSEAWNEKRMM